MRLPALSVALAVLVSASVEAATPPKPWHEFNAGEAVRLEPDKAYILVRTVDLFGFRFVRIAGDDGSKVERANLAELNGYRTIDKAFPGFVHLVAVAPGTYWLYGTKTEDWLDGPWLYCLCVGTVRFDAKPGVVTDLGTIRDLALETRGGKRPDSRGRRHDLLNNRLERAIVVEPVSVEATVPAAIATLPRVGANYRAAGWLPNIDGARIDRVSAMPGIITYERDRVVDVRTGKTYP
jgi:hypothetical protein